MNAEIDLIAGYWTLAGDTNPFAKSEVSPFPLRDRIEAAASAGYRGIGLLRADLMATIGKSAAGYRGVHSVEIISREHRKRTLEEAARRSFETTMNQFGD
jgi:hypothetical protein